MEVNMNKEDKNKSSGYDHYSHKWKDCAGREEYTGRYKNKEWKFEGNDRSGKPYTSMNQPNTQQAGSSNQKSK